MLNRLDRYILAQVRTPLLMTLAVAALLLLLERMLRLFDFVVNQGGPVEVVFRLLGNLIPHYLGMALPIGLFLGILIAFRNLSLNSEIDAIGASGVGLRRLLRPVMYLSLVLMAVQFVLVSYVQPFSRYYYHGLVFDLRSGALGASVKVGEFVNIGKGMVLRINESRNNGTELLGIFLERTQEDGRRVAISAEKGGFFSTPDQQNVILRLYNGRLLEINEKRDRPRVLTFDQQDIAVRLPEIEEFRRRGEQQRELTIIELWTAINDPNLDKATYDEYRGNFHWRLAETLTFLILPFLAISLGIANRRTGQSLGLVIGLSLIILYNELQEMCVTLVVDGTASPFVTIWLLYAAFFALSLRFMYLRTARVGGDPLYWVELLWAASNRPVKRITKRVTEALT